jgi:hypothetical protein
MPDPGLDVQVTKRFPVAIADEMGKGTLERSRRRLDAGPEASSGARREGSYL